MYTEKTTIHHEDGTEELIIVRGDADDEVLASFEVVGEGFGRTLKALSPRHPSTEILGMAKRAAGPGLRFLELDGNWIATDPEEH